jgi:hypothetical protein
VTRLQHIFTQHQTTDESTDYDDYPSSFEVDEKPTRFDLSLPLIPIIDDNDTSIYTIAEGVDKNSNNEPTVVQYGIEFDNSSFRDEVTPNSTTISEQNSATNILTTNNDTDNIENLLSSINDDNEIHEEKILNENESEWNNDDENKNESVENVTQSINILEYENETEIPTTTVVTELHDENDSEAATTTEHVMNLHLESLEEKSEAEKAISNSSNPINIHLVDDYFDAMLLNDSLITIDSSYSNVTESDYDITTTQEIETTTIPTIQFIDDSPQSESSVSSDLENISFKPEDISTSTMTNLKTEENQSILIESQQNDNDEFNQKLNEYHYETVTENIFSVLNILTTSPSTRRTPSLTHFVRFPNDNNERKHLMISQQTSSQVKFPDESDSKISRQSSSSSSSSFSWPRDDNGYVSFWREQPLINDSKAFSSGFSRGIISSFNRHNHASYRGAYG